MFEEKTLAVVIPAYNEQKLIGKVINTLPDFVDHIVVVDDKSLDSTVAEVHLLAKNEPRLVLLCH